MLIYLNGFIYISDVVREHYDNFNFYKGIDAIIATLHTANLFFETTKPWELRKHEHLRAKLNTCIHLILETLRICSILLQPVLPQLTNRLLSKIKIPDGNRTWECIKPCSWEQIGINNNQLFGGTLLANESNVLFQRIKSGSKQNNIKQQNKSNR